MNDFQVIQHLTQLTPSKPSITARIEIKEENQPCLRSLHELMWTAPNCYFVSLHLGMNGISFISLICYHFQHSVQQYHVQMRI